jgi:hypothetical protein
MGAATMMQQTFLPFFQSPEVPLALFAIAVLAAAVFLFTRQPDRITAFSNETGDVLVSRRAIHNVIEQCCEGLKEVGSARVTVSWKEGSLHTLVRLRIHADARLENTSGYLQQQIRGMLKENLGLENIGRIDIDVTGILPPAPEREQA